ncbi:MAG TPA: formylmethanofuran dehydrogenase [Tissierellia bacterium]|jgi:formylmethanofuran dehydrogenase subunit E|nr:formylmethanofuran dehydrogenase [Tissierellia bacterium]
MNRELWEKSVGFHGHECPGLAIGVRACEAAAERLGVSYSKDEEVVCITENNACGVDAVQFITGCTFGKGNLIFKDKGKQAFTFFRRDIGQGIRVVFKGVNKLGDRKKWQEYILNAPLNELFDFKTPNYELPPKAKIYSSVQCEICGEYAAESRIRLKDGQKVCLDCFCESNN